MNPYGKKEEIYGYQTLYREIGYYISRLEQYDRALKLFDTAISKTPEDKRALIGRSRTRAKAIQYEGAIEDINKALNLDPDNLVVLADKALNTYLICEFESGLVQNSRLVPIRQKPDHFTMGVMHCTNAIESCLGERAGRPLRDHFQIIRKLAWKSHFDAQKPYEPKPQIKSKKKRVTAFRDRLKAARTKEPVQPKLTAKKTALHGELDIRDSLHSKQSDGDLIPPFGKPFPFKPLQNYTTNIENYMAEKYLDSMYLDKIFLKNLEKAPGTHCPNQKGSQKIKLLANNCYNTVSYKQELLRVRRPFYFIKYQEGTVTGALKARQKLELEQQQLTTKNEADVILNKLLEAYETKELQSFLDFVEKLKRYCDSKPKKFLPDKQTYMDEIYDKICKAFYEVYRLNPEQNFFDQNKRLYVLLGLPLTREPSMDSVIEQFKSTFLDYSKEILEFENRVRTASSAEELCWYYHELSRYHLDTKKFDLARVYAKKCTQQSKRINNIRWNFNANMLLAKCNLRQHNKNDATIDLENALQCAKELSDKNKSEFLSRCFEIVDSVEFDDMLGTKVLEKRERKIIEMMASSKMKDEVVHLFSKMSAMPASRRMTIMPGIKIDSSSSKEKRKSQRNKMSILPTAADSKEDDIVEIKRSASKKLQEGAAEHSKDATADPNLNDNFQYRYKCPINFQNIGRKCYYFNNNNKVTWFQAYYACKGISNSNLTVLSERQDSRQFEQYLFRNRRNLFNDTYWIGGFKNWKQKKWVFTDGSPILYISAKDIEQQREDSWTCLLVDTKAKRWKANNCMEPKPYVCETEPDALVEFKLTNKKIKKKITIDDCINNFNSLLKRQKRKCQKLLDGKEDSVKSNGSNYKNSDDDNNAAAILQQIKPAYPTKPTTVTTTTTIIAAPSQAVSYICPQNWMIIGSHCYLFSRTKATWSDAHFSCSQINSKLAVIRSKVQNQKLRIFLNGFTEKEERWIGARYNDKSNKWIWAVNGRQLKYNGFAKEVIANATGEQYWKAIIMDPKYGYQWNYRNEMEQHNYICQIRGRSVKRSAHQQLRRPAATIQIMPDPRYEVRSRQDRRNHKNRSKRLSNISNNNNNNNNNKNRRCKHTF